MPSGLFTSIDTSSLIGGASSIDSLNSSLRDSLSFLENEYVATALGIFLVLYASLAAPKLPSSVAKLFDSPLFRALLLFLIAYSANRNPAIALVATVGFILSLQTLNRYKVKNGDDLENETSESKVVLKVPQNSESNNSNNQGVVENEK